MRELRLTKSLLRPLRMTDAESIARNGNNPKIAGNMRDMFPSPYHPEHAERWIGMSLSPENRDLLWGIEVDGHAVGAITLRPQEDVHRLGAETGYWIGEEYWGRGIAVEALQAVCQYAFEHTDFIRIFGVVFQHNKASAKVLEKAGFRHEATHKRAVIKNNEILDEYIYVLLK